MRIYNARHLKLLCRDYKNDYLRANALFLSKVFDDDDIIRRFIHRNYEIKDYGKLIPGHGGILDRFDSVIFTAPIIYYLTMALAGNL